MCVQRLIHQADTNAIFDLIAALSRRLLAALAAPAQLHHVRISAAAEAEFHFCFPGGFSAFFKWSLRPACTPGGEGALFDWQVNEGRCS